MSMLARQSGPAWYFCSCWQCLRSNQNAVKRTFGDRYFFGWGDLVEMAWSAVVAVAFCIGLIWVCRPVAGRIGLVDLAGGHKKHEGAVPVVGGVAMSGALVLTLPAFFGIQPFSLLGLYVGIALIAALGAVDDRAHVAAPWRLSLQVLIVLLAFIVLSGMTIDQLGDLTGTGTVQLGWVAIPFTLFACVGVMNAINMVDGVDGLAGLFAFQVLLALGVLAQSTASVFAELIPTVAAVVLGFLIFNLRAPWRRRANVFMGDAGSLMLGLVLTWFAVALTQAVEKPLEPMVMVWLFGLPLLDTAFVVVSRLLRGRNPMAADRSHFHHYLLWLGLSHGQTALAWNAVAAMFVVTGIIGHWLDLSSMPLFYGFVVVASLYIALAASIWRRMERRQQRAVYADVKPH